MTRTARSLVLVLVVCVALGAAVTAAAGPYTDDMSRCLVRSTTPQDKTLLVQWIFSMMALHPDVKDLACITPERRAEINTKTAALFERLLTDACLAETRDALKYEGMTAIETSFGVLGQVASRALFTDPDVAAGGAELQKLLDLDRLQKELGVETGAADEGTAPEESAEGAEAPTAEPEATPPPAR